MAPYSPPGLHCPTLQNKTSPSPLRPVPLGQFASPPLISHQGPTPGHFHKANKKYKGIQKTCHRNSPKWHWTCSFFTSRYKSSCTISQDWYNCLNLCSVNQFVTQALPLIARTCTDICGAAYYAPRLTAAARALVQDMERQLGLAPGDGVSGIAEWLVGSPPISLLLEEFLVPGNLRQGLPALQVSYTLLHLVGPLCRTNGRPERIFVHNPNPGRDKGKGKGKGNQAKGQGKGKGGRGKGKQDPPPRERSPRGLQAAPARAGAPPLTQQQAQGFPIRQTPQWQRRDRLSNNRQDPPRNPCNSLPSHRPTTPHPDMRGAEAETPNVSG